MGSKHTYRSLSTARWAPPAPLVSATERHRNDTSSVETSTTTLTEPVRLADCDGPFTAGRLEDCRQPATSPTGARRVAVVVFVSVSSRRMGVAAWEWDYGRATRKQHRRDGGGSQHFGFVLSFLSYSAVAPALAESEVGMKPNPIHQTRTRYKGGDPDQITRIVVP